MALPPDRPSIPTANTRLAQGFRLIEKCGAGAEVGALVAEFVETIALFGFNTVACGGWVRIGTSPTPRFYFNTWPQAGLDLFFISYAGGSTSLGALWEVTPPSSKGGGWTGGIIHNFCAMRDQYNDCPDGYGPQGAPAIDVDGGLYGTTNGGGAGPQGGNGVICFMQPPFTPGTSAPVSVIHEVSPAESVRGPFGDTSLSKQGQVLTLLDFGEAGTPPNQAEEEGVVLSVSPQTQADTILSNAFAADPVQTGPYIPDTSLSTDKQGNLYGASQQYLGSVAPSGSLSPAVVYKITP